MAGTTKKQIKAYRAANPKGTSTSSGGGGSPRESVDQTVARAKAMTAQNAAEGVGKTAFKGSSYEADYKAGKYNTPVITPEKMDSTTVPAVVTPPKVDPLTGLMDGNNAALTDPMNGLSQKDKQFVYDPKASESVNAANEANANLQSMLGPILSYLKPEEGQSEKAMKAAIKESGINTYRKEYNDISAQLNTIQSNAEAEALGLEGQGRGITESIIGGQQAQIRREAAIQALPLQAQLAAAQGNVELAQSNLNMLMQVKMKDIDAQTAYKGQVVSSYLSYATSAQQNLLNAKLSDIQTRAQEKKDRLNLVNEWSLKAVETGQNDLISSFTALDPASPTFEQDFGRLQAKVQKPMAGAGSTQDWTLFNKSDGTTVQYNQRTGEIRPLDGGGALGGAGDTQKTLDNISFLNKTIENAQGLVDATGPNLITQGMGNFFVGNTRVKQLNNQLETLKVNLLTLSSDPNIKKFFGPQMTEKDTELLMSAGSTLNAYSNSVEGNEAELERYTELLNRMKTSVETGGQYAQFGIVLTGADGERYQIVEE